MSIWTGEYTVDLLNRELRGGLLAHLDIVFDQIGDDWLSASMPVRDAVLQPAGILHGGASLALAESVGSTAANMVLDRERFLAVGMEINANHVRSVSGSGSMHHNARVIATARPLHLGKTSQVWDIRISDEGGRLVAVSRLTMAVLER